MTWFNPVVGTWLFTIYGTNSAGSTWYSWYVSVSASYSVYYYNEQLDNALVDYSQPITISNAISAGVANIINKDVLVIFTFNGIEIKETVKSDIYGTYSYTYYPSPQDVGQAQLLVTRPNSSPPYSIIHFELIGMSLSPPTSEIPVFSFVLGRSTSNNTVLTINNLSARTMTGLHANVTIVTPSPYLTGVNISVASTLSGYASTNVNVEIYATNYVPRTQVDIVFSSNEGATIKTTIYVEVPTLAPTLVSKTLIQGTFVPGEQTVYEYIVSNEGYADTGILSVTLPETDGITLVSPSTIPSLAPGQSFSIFFLITPPESIKRVNASSVITSSVIVSSEESFVATNVQVIATGLPSYNVLIIAKDEQSMYFSLFLSLMYR